MTHCNDHHLREQILSKLVDIDHAICSKYRILALSQEIQEIFLDLYDLIDEAFGKEDGEPD